MDLLLKRFVWPAQLYNIEYEQETSLKKTNGVGLKKEKI